MKPIVGNEATVLEQSGVTDNGGRKASVHLTKEVFEILGSKLYQNKVKAPIQELSTNAVDAHKMVGKGDIPFEVKLPNTLDPEFYVKDFGPGLSHSDMQNIYMEYFNSTKRDSNEVTGFFGLGSKTPACYTDQYSVVSVHKGVMRSYIVVKDENGFPTLHCLDEQGTEPPKDWTSGLKVSFPVRTEDYARFVEEAGKVFRWFKVKPIVRGVDFKAIENKFLEQNELFSVLDPSCETKSRHYSNHASWVQMGNIGYLVDKNQTSSLFTVEEHSFLTTTGVVLNVPIGSVNPVVSREALDYDKHTVAYLKQHIAKITEKFVAEFFNLLGTDPDLRKKADYMEYCTRYFKYGFKSTAWLKNALTQAVELLKTQSSNQNDPFVVRNTSAVVSEILDARINLTEIPEVRSTSDVKLVVFEETYRTHNLTARSISEFSGKISRGNNTFDAYMTFMDDLKTVIFLEDGTHASSRVKEALEAKFNNYGTGLLVTGKDKFKTLDVANKLAKILGNLDIVKTSTLPESKAAQVRSAIAASTKAAKASAGGSTAPRVRLSLQERLAHYGNMEVLSVITEKEPQSGVYISKLSKVLLKDALDKNTVSYQLVNFVSQNLVFKDEKRKNKHVSPGELRTFVQSAANVDERFVEAGVCNVLLLSSSEANKLKAEVNFKDWSVNADEAVTQIYPDLMARASSSNGIAGFSLQTNSNEELYTWDLQERVGFKYLVRLMRDDMSSVVNGGAGAGMVFSMFEFYKGLSNEVKAVIRPALDVVGLCLDGDMPKASDVAKIGNFCGAYSRILRKVRFVEEITNPNSSYITRVDHYEKWYEGLIKSLSPESHEESLWNTLDKYRDYFALIDFKKVTKENGALTAKVINSLFEVICEELKEKEKAEKLAA